MENEVNATSLLAANKQTSLAETLKAIDKTCKSCDQSIPTTCILGCKTWNLKNQLRKLHEKATNPDFTTTLLNTLKNKRRLQLLKLISRKYYSLVQLQQELRKLGFNLSQLTIVEEYVNPLMIVGLAESRHGLYHATLFGQKISDMTRDFHDMEDILSPHSECYEETTIGALMKGPKTYENLKELIPEKSVPRVLNRLQAAVLAETGTEKDHIFFFTTKRNPNGLDFSPTEKRIYRGIPQEGIAARKLAKEAGISLRRTYRYLRRLKGKKLVFTRNKPVTYSITARGIKIGTMLREVHDLATEALAATTCFSEDEQANKQMADNSESTERKRKDVHFVPLTTLQPIREENTFSQDSCDTR